MKRYVGFIDLFHVLTAAAIILIVSLVFTYLLSCTLYVPGRCRFMRAMKEYFFAVTIIIGGIAVVGHILTFTLPVSGVARSTLVNPELAKHGGKAVETGHSDLMSMLNTFIGFLVALAISWIIQYYILSLI